MFDLRPAFPLPTLGAALGLAVWLSACATQYSHSNSAVSEDSRPATKATFDVTPDRGDPKTLMILAFSGGGSRAAYWSTSVMFRLRDAFEDVDLMAEVDAISAVSGGSLPAAYYAISRDVGDAGRPNYGRVWEEAEVKRLMATDFFGKWVRSWFRPDNFFKFWFTAYDRTDIMAETFANTLYDDRNAGRALLVGDILPGRPYLILNATDGTTESFGEPFTFTEEDFARIGSDLGGYSLARAVMATASFPAVFNYMTLRDYSHEGDDPSDLRYRHVFDGGPYDNLGLMSVIRILERMEAEGTIFDRLVVILVDAYARNVGVDADQADPREATDYFVDSNALGATDGLLTTNRRHTLRLFRTAFQRHSILGRSIFYHVTFDSLTDRATQKAAQRIPTDFRLELPEDAKTLDAAAEQLLNADNSCLQAVRALLAGRLIPAERQICQWPEAAAD